MRIENTLFRMITMVKSGFPTYMHYVRNLCSSTNSCSDLKMAQLIMRRNDVDRPKLDRLMVALCSIHIDN